MIDESEIAGFHFQRFAPKRGPRFNQLPARCRFSVDARLTEGIVVKLRLYKDPHHSLIGLEVKQLDLS